MMSLSARKVRVLVLQLIEASTVILPSSEPAPAVVMVTSPVVREFCVAVAMAESTVIFTGSISHSPPLVATLRSLSILTVAADVSTKLASREPEAMTSPLLISPSNKIRPFWLARVLA